MHPNPRRILPVLLILIVLAVAIYYALPAFSGPSRLLLSGTIEATEVKVAAEIGGRVSFVTAEEGQAVTLDQILLELHPRSGSNSNTERVRSPIDGVVLYRSIEPGEIASPGAPLLTIADLSRLTLIVYAPEDQYGRIILSSEYPVTVDSFPGEIFTGTVSSIAGKAEFTPRNVQTIESRKTTVYAVKLAVANPDGKLKAGMPADVDFGAVAP